MDSKKHIHKFTMVVCAIFLLAVLTYWVYKFGIFAPERGTSIASSSILWGQFIVSFLAVIALDVILIIADTRQKQVSIIKLVSFWFLIIALLIGGYFYYHKKVSYGFTHTYKVGEEFQYLTYKFKINSAELKDIPLKDCSILSDKPLSTGRLFGSKSDKNLCEDSNNSIKDKKRAFVNLTVSNIHDTFKHFTPDWFELTSSSGEKYLLYSWTDNNIPNELQPNSINRGDLVASRLNSTYFNSFFDNDETIYSIKIKIDNHAEQVVKVAN